MAGWDWNQYAIGGAQRPDSFSGMDPTFNSQLQQLFMNAPEDVRSGLRVKSGFRSVDRQAALFADAIKKYGSESAARKWVAPPGRSYHNKGNAADLDYASPAAREYAHANAAKYGLNFPLGNEDWHIEPIGARGAGHQHAAPSQGFTGDPVADVLAAGGNPVSPAPAVGVSPATFFGDILAPQAEAPFGNVVANYLQSRKQRDDQAEAENAKRQALLASVGSPFGRG
jgi:hypothetical protein